MKVIIHRAELMTGVSTAIRAVPSKTTMKILECIVIRCIGDEIRILSNDMEMAISTTVSGSVAEPGEIAVDAKLFSEIVRKLPDDDVVIESDENCLVSIRCGQADFSLNGRTTEEFPEIPEVEQEHTMLISSYTLKNTILQTLFATAQNESSILMSGELFAINGDKLTVTALDGHRIAIRNVSVNSSNCEAKVIVPGKTLGEVSKILTGEMDDSVTLSFTDNHMLFEMEDTKVVTRLIEGEYYNVNSMISTDYVTRFTVNKQMLLSCIDRSLLFVREGDKKPIILNVGEDVLGLSIRSPLGSMKEDLPIHMEGKEMKLGFNPRLVMDALKVIDESDVTVYLMNAHSPCFIRDDENTYSYIVLPVNISREADDQ